MKLVLTIALLSSLALVTWASAKPACPPALGPGAVRELHVKLFAAIDAGDEAGTIACLDLAADGGPAEGDTVGEDGPLPRPSAFLLDAYGLPIEAAGPEALKAAFVQVARASKDGGPAWSTKILKSRCTCHSADLSYGVFEFERSRGVKGGTRRYVATSLVRYVEGAWKLMHIHISAADKATAELAGAGASKR